MPIESPRLDDLTYDRVVDDLVRRIPVYAPQWTDFNQSDPGITLIQLFAQLAEQVGYRLNRMPEKAHIELLKLLGVRLLPSHAARTRLAVLLADPATATAFTLAAGTAAAARTGSPPPVFTTWEPADIVPAQLALLLTTRNPLLNDLRKPTASATTDEAPAEPFDPAAFPADDSEWLSLRWDGRKPKDKDLPTQPLTLLPVTPRPHRYLWLGIQFNGAPDAGFRGVRVDLHVQLDDDEQPTRAAIGACGPTDPVGEAPPAIDWLHAWDAGRRTMRPISGRIDDSTGRLARSGRIRFEVPATLGTIVDADWRPLQAAGTLGPLDACLLFASTLGDTLGDTQIISGAVRAIADEYRARLATELDARWAAASPAPAIDALIAAMQDALRAALDQTWPTPPPLADIGAFYLDVAKARIDALVLPTGLTEVSAMIRDAFRIMVDVNQPGLMLIPLPPLVVHTVVALILGANWAPLSSQIHDWFRQRAKTNLDSAWSGLAVPNALIEDLAAFFMDQLRPVVDGLFSLPAVDAARSGVAQYYRDLVDQAVAAVWVAEPTAQIAALADQYRQAVEDATGAVVAAAAELKPYVAHPLAGRHRSADRVAGWIRIDLPDELIADPARAPKVRHIGFNVVAVEHAQGIRNEVIGAGSGEPGQQLALRNRNVLPGSLELALQEETDPTAPLQPWTEVPTLEDRGPFERVYTLDREAGVVAFGDGVHGRIPPLVAGGGLVVAKRYRHGGGLSGEVGVGAITALRSAPAAVASAMNIVAATGGHDAETLDQAKLRARKELSTRSRAVVADDFVWFAEHTEAVRVGRAICVPLRRALAEPGQGLDDVVAAGAVAVVVVPDQRDVPEPLPTRSFLRAVCQHLDRFRLVTTELHVVPPQYCRLSAFAIRVVARPGYTRTMLQDLVEARLGAWLHPLTGGDDGNGSPFGGQLHVADLVALVLRVEGVDRVDDLVCAFSRTKTNASPRNGRLVLCPGRAGDVEKLTLSAEECPSVDVASLTLTTVV